MIVLPVLRIDCADGGVAVMRILPLGLAQGDAFIPGDYRRDGDANTLVLRGHGVEGAPEPGVYTSAPEGWEIVFSEPEGEFAKWMADQEAAEAREAVAAAAQGQEPPATRLPATWSRIEEAGIPADRAFRNAWAASGGRISVDMEKARGIHRDRIRVARKPLLAALDVEYHRADERGDAGGKSDVASRKQALRDATADPAIAAAKTPEELSAVWPAALQQR